jgi:trimeric autotransporter adhesin
MGPGTNDPANLYFNMGGTSDFWQSGTPGGFVLKNGGSIIDAVATGGTGTTYTFAAGTGVTAADWTGTTVATSGRAGITRTGATDNNTIADWTLSSATSLQTVGTYNGGFTVPSASFTYVWSPSTGLNNSTIANPVATVTGNITYTVTATETLTGCSGSTNVALTVAALPAITTQPSNQTVCAGSTASFTVAATGTAITYQWRKNGVNIAGATSATYSKTNVTTADAGTYDVVVSGQCPPAVTSNGVTLTVNTPPGIVSGAPDQSLCVGSRFVARPTISGTSLTYQWYKGSTALAGETRDSLVIASVASGDAGTYILVVSGVCPPATVSDSMTLLVNGAPIITGQPTGSTVCLGASATFTVTASGSGLTYQWRKGGTNIAGATSATYTIAATTATDGGSYDVVITSSCATTATSSAVTLTVNMPPAITVQPTAQTSCLANSATFSVTATGAGLTYQWRKNGVNIAGANASTYTITNVSAADLGNYDVVVTGTCGSPATSNSVALNLSSTNTWLGRMNSDWNNAGNWCSGIPTSTTDVLIPSGTPFAAIINTSGDVRNLTIQTGATLTIPAGGTLNIYGDLVNTGTLTATSGTIAFRGATNQAIPAVSAAYIVMNGAGGITLSGNMTAGTALVLTNGNITLGSNNFIMTGGSIGSVTSHIITNGTGVVTINNVTTAAVVFPIGPNATSYNPAAVANGSGRNFSAKVAVGLTPAVPNPTRAINRTWTITPSATSATPAYVGVQYADADGNASYLPATNMEMGVHNGTAWTQISVPGGMAAVGTATARQVGATTTVFGPIAVANVGGIISPLAVSNLDADVTSAMLMPNVVKDKTQMQVVVRKAVKVEWNITDASGRVVRTFSKRLVAGVNTIELSVGDLAGGTYYITGVTEKGKVNVLKMIRL